MALRKRPYTQAIDMWSLGCIMLEMYLGREPFSGADSDEQVIKRITEVIGDGRSSNLYQFLRCPPEGSHSFLFFQLVEAMLQCDPQKRISIQDA